MLSGTDPWCKTSVREKDDSWFLVTDSGFLHHYAVRDLKIDKQIKERKSYSPSACQWGTWQRFPSAGGWVSALSSSCWRCKCCSGWPAVSSPPWRCECPRCRTAPGERQTSCRRNYGAQEKPSLTVQGNVCAFVIRHL